MAIAINTLAYARRLREAGFTEQQAEGQAEALAEAMTESIATKQDLQELGTRVGAGFASVRHEIRELESRWEVRFEKIEGRFALMDSRFDSLDLRLAEMERRIDVRQDQKLADLERRMTLRLGGLMMAGIVVFSALNRLG